MTNATQYANAQLNYVVGRTDILGSGLTRYLRAWTTMPDVTGAGGTEVSGGGYTALLLSVASHWNTAAASGSISNTGEIAFATATGNWGLVAGVTFESASSGGTLYRVTPFANSVPVSTDETLRIPVGQLTLTQT